VNKSTIKLFIVDLKKTILLFKCITANSMSVILQAALPNQVFISESDKIEITNYVNKYRKLHKSPDLVWDDMIANYSQEWSNYLLINNLFQHSGSSIYGENLSYFKGYEGDPLTFIKWSIDMWYQEIEYYDFNKPGFKSSTGHFTCLVWKDSKKFGMGISISDKTVVVSFNTSPPGNIIGEFETNVLPKDTTIPTPTPTPIPQSEPVPPSEQAPIEYPSEVENLHLHDHNKILHVVTMLYKIITELKKKNSNKQMIIHHLQQIILKLIT
jgi:hypothetical protein